MHGDVKQEDLYQHFEFHYPQGRGFAPWRAGPNMMCSVCSHLNIFNFFLIATAPILFKFDMMHLWDIPVRIRVRIDPPHPLVCRKRRLNGAVLRMRPEKPRSRVTAGVAR